jgi:hypothetical protein
MFENGSFSSKNILFIFAIKLSLIMIFYGGKSYPCSFVIKFITKHLINSTRDNVRNDISLHKVSSPINSKRVKVNTANAKFTTCGVSGMFLYNNA